MSVYDKLAELRDSREGSEECYFNGSLEDYLNTQDAKNADLFAKYRELADREEGVIFGGRLGEYKYYDMDKVIASALGLVKKEFTA